MQQASNEVIKTVTSSAPKAGTSQTSLFSTQSSTGSTSSESSPVTDAAKSDKTVDILATTDSSKTDAAKKQMFCN